MGDRSSGRRGARSLAGWVVLFLVVAVVSSAVAATISAVPALADETPTPLGDVSASPSADPSASPSAEPSPDPSASPAPYALTYALSQPVISYLGTVTVTGVVTPDAEGLEVAVAVDGVDVATVLTDAAGAFTAGFVAERNCVVSARLTADGTTGPLLPLAVRPTVTTGFGTPVPFLPTRFVVNVAPADYDGYAVARVYHRGVLVGTVVRQVVDGRVVFRLPTPGIEWFKVECALRATEDFARKEFTRNFEVPYRTLRVGSTGLIVEGLLTRLSQLRIRVPAVDRAFGVKDKDAVVAFQKAYRLTRDYVVNYADWRKLEFARVVKPRYASPSVHIEIDKTRQILMVVRDGKVAGLLACSTGATGNTPEGAFAIRSKLLMSVSFSGTALLPYTMGFYGEFAIHGYYLVPPYPASHGCVREPIWASSWVYYRSFIGERVYIYR
jgi:peptidoglycan hydrolase-like protein with peptidoglycan-binding domain